MVSALIHTDLWASLPAVTQSGDGFVHLLAVVSLALGALLTQWDNRALRTLGFSVMVATPVLYGVLASVSDFGSPDGGGVTRLLHLDSTQVTIVTATAVVFAIALALQGFLLQLDGLRLEKPDMVRRGKTLRRAGAVVNLVVVMIGCALFLFF